MLTTASKCPSDLMWEAANLVIQHQDFLKENLPGCSNPTQVVKTLTASDSWFLLVDGKCSAILRLEISGPIATVWQICVVGGSLEEAISGLRGDLRAKKVSNLTLRVSVGEAERFTASGFQRGSSYTKFSRVPTESNMMPLLPLMNPTLREVSMLSQLMYLAYAKTGGFFDTHATESSLRAIMSGARGAYLSDASFASGAPPNIVSACLLTTDAPGQASIEQLFTHPLYRARGLATIEIGAAMNRLSSSGVTILTAWNREGNEVVRRLLTKLNFVSGMTVVEMSGSV